MLSLTDYNHLKLLYDKFFKFNVHIKSLIELGDWDNVDFAVQEKESIIRQIIFFEKPRLKEIKANKELMSLRNKLVELEKANIELVKKIREEFLNELLNIKKTKKVLNAYEPITNNTVSTFEVKEFE